jgi:hypothetical protein
MTNDEARMTKRRTIGALRRRLRATICANATARRKGARAGSNTVPCDDTFSDCTNCRRRRTCGTRTGGRSRTGRRHFAGRRRGRRRPGESRPRKTPGARSGFRPRYSQARRAAREDTRRVPLCPRQDREWQTASQFGPCASVLAPQGTLGGGEHIARKLIGICPRTGSATAGQGARLKPDLGVKTRSAQRAATKRLRDCVAADDSTDQRRCAG